MSTHRIIVLVLLVIGSLARPSDAQTLGLSLFERYLESLRQQAGIPGLSAVIVQERRIVWERGFGQQDIENSIAATPATPYPIGGITQTFAATLLLQCSERGALGLDERIVRWSPLIPEPGATVRQVMAHMSTGVPGSRFAFDPARYAALTPVIESCGSRAYRQLLADDVFDRLAMVDTVPGHDVEEPAARARQLFDAGSLEQYEATLRRLAVPYRVDSRGRAARSDFPDKGANAATGLISTARDLARFDAALDDGVLLRPESLAMAWSNVVQVTGTASPAGLGWFSQTYNGQRLIWHFGVLPNAYSSLILKVPGRNLTLILLANSDGLSAPFPLAEGDVTTSLFARLFLRLFI